ncbi:glucokinase [Candidatus Manganitrophus noduliformans]|uniref:Glucokinase n=1 Tax=Candidatus Manganitrophus noduliformans TaxID=2606439 RepID=A0A7X6DN65_9BACT|nr:glucokinase [Candidatus Manganitrophus noduliformans]NKE70265.1 glucokinase [Candidatus Manganitrophus noduliformans]
MILAGDIGGTKTILALFTCDGEKPVLLDEQVFPSRSYADFSQVVQEFLKDRKTSFREACFGVAGPVVNGRCETTNLPWTVEADQIGRRFKIPSVALLNDLEATAYGALGLTEKGYCSLNPGQADAGGNRAVIAAGTGLGEAILFWDGSTCRPSASEGGHADFAPRNPLEIELLEYLLKRYTRVSYERVLSGPGIWNIYQFLRDAGEGEEPSWLSERLSKEDPSSVISEAALAGKADLCVKALDLFVSVYGAEAGNLALKALTTGGIYVGGGIAPKILSRLIDGAFMKGFLDKGRFASLMSRIPVRVILDEKTALLGAARYACIQGGKSS